MIDNSAARLTTCQRVLSPRAIYRLNSDIRLQAAFRRLHACGPRPVGSCFAELLDHLGVDPAELDFVLDWHRFDPAFVAAIAGEFPPPPLDLVPAP